MGKLKPTEATLSLRLSWKAWVVFAVCTIFGLFLCERILQLYLCERHFRDGYYLMQKEYAPVAISEMQLAVDLAPWEPYYRLHLAKAVELLAESQPNPAEQARIYKQTIPIYQDTEAQDDTNPWYKNRLSYIYSKLAELEPATAAESLRKAEQYAKEAAMADYHNPLFVLAYAQFLHRLGNFDDALRYYKLVHSYDPSLLEAPYNMADIYTKQGRVQDAVKAYLEVVAQNPDFENTMIALSQLYLTNHMGDSAVPLLENARKKAPFNTRILELLAYALFDQKKWAEAIDVCNEYLAINPDGFSVIQIKTVALINQKKRAEAWQTFSPYYNAHLNDADAQLFRRQIFR